MIGYSLGVQLETVMLTLIRMSDSLTALDGQKLLSGHNCSAIYVHSDQGEYPSDNAG